MQAWAGALVSLVVLLAATGARACSCRSEDESTFRSFEGRVASIAEGTEEREGAVWGLRTVCFEALKARSGPLPAQPVCVRTGKGNGDCGFPFSVGVSYLVFLQHREDGVLETDICTPTRRVGEELATALVPIGVASVAFLALLAACAVLGFSWVHRRRTS